MQLMTRRHFGRITSLSSLAWLASNHFGLADAICPAASRREPRAKALIMLWMGGGPSQFETWDPKPGLAIGGPTKSIKTRVAGIDIAENLPRVAAEVMDQLTIIRSMTTKEGDHERGTYLMKTGYQPTPTVLHPALGAICAAELPEDRTEIPRYISILSGDKATRGGYLGDEFDAFRTFDPRDPLTDVNNPVTEPRRGRRIEDLDVIESSFGRRFPSQPKRTLHRDSVDRALRMMSSEQLAAFKIEDEPESLRKEYGDSPFGRGCLAARRLIEMAGVRCVEVALNGWDTHVNNFGGTQTQTKQLDPALATLIRDLKEHDLLDSTIVLCTGEFGRTPTINPASGRDHWPTGFSLALAGGGFRGGHIIGETPQDKSPAPKNPVNVDDLYATLLTAMGIDPAKSVISPIGRPMKLSEGKPLRQLLG